MVLGAKYARATFSQKNRQIPHSDSLVQTEKGRIRTEAVLGFQLTLSLQSCGRSGPWMTSSLEDEDALLTWPTTWNKESVSWTAAVPCLTGITLPEIGLI